MTKEIFEIYVETQLAPTIDPGDVVILDNLPSHKSENARQILSSVAPGSSSSRPTAPT